MRSILQNIKNLSLVAILLLSLNSFADIPETVSVQLEFNGSATNVSKDVSFSIGITALEALMFVAKVQTHPAGGYVFVDIINDVANEKGNNAWYFTVNDVLSDKLANNRELKAGDTVKWIYKQDVCSQTIETSKPSRKVTEQTE